MKYKTINERGSDKARLLNWLIQPKQGIREGLAEVGVQDFELELQRGKEPHKTCHQFKKLYERIAGHPRFPESFWIDNYILFWCRRTEEKMLGEGTTQILSELKAKQAGDAVRILGELKLKQAENYKSMILLIILNTLIILNLVTSWIL